MRANQFLKTLLVHVLNLPWCKNTRHPSMSRCRRWWDRGI